MFKVCYHPKTEEIRQDVLSHSFAIQETGVQFDKWVRALVFPDLKRVYFRFYTPSGDYYHRTEDDTQYSFNICEAAAKQLVAKHVIKKSWKVLFWETDTRVTYPMVKFS